MSCLQSLVLNEELRLLCVGHDREREQWRREQQQAWEQVQDLQEERRWEGRGGKGRERGKEREGKGRGRTSVLLCFSGPRITVSPRLSLYHKTVKGDQ